MGNNIACPMLHYNIQNHLTVTEIIGKADVYAKLQNK